MAGAKSITRRRSSPGGSGCLKPRQNLNVAVLSRFSCRRACGAAHAARRRRGRGRLSRHGGTVDCHRQQPNHPTALRPPAPPPPPRLRCVGGRHRGVDNGENPTGTATGCPLLSERGGGGDGGWGCLAVREAGAARHAPRRPTVPAAPPPIASGQRRFTSAPPAIPVPPPSSTRHTR